MQGSPSAHALSVNNKEDGLGWAQLCLPPQLWSATLHVSCCSPASLGGSRKKAGKGETESRTHLAIMVWDKQPPIKG